LARVQPPAENTDQEQRDCSSDAGARERRLAFGLSRLWLGASPHLGACLDGFLAPRLWRAVFLHLRLLFHLVDPCSLRSAPGGPSPNRQAVHCSRLRCAGVTPVVANSLLLIGQQCSV